MKLAELKKRMRKKDPAFRKLDDAVTKFEKQAMKIISTRQDRVTKVFELGQAFVDNLPKDI